MARGRFGVRSPSRCGTRTRPPAPAGAASAKSSNCCVVDAEQPGHGVGHLGGVHGADQRQEASGGVGEAGHRAGGVGAGPRRATVNAVPLVPEAQREVPRAAGRARARRPCCRPSRARPGSPRPGHIPGDGERGEHLGQRWSPSRRVSSTRSEQVRAVAPLARGPVPGARGVAPVGRPPAGEPEREPVVGEQDRAPSGRRSRARSAAASAAW